MAPVAIRREHSLLVTLPQGQVSLESNLHYAPPSSKNPSSDLHWAGFALPNFKDAAKMLDVPH